MVPVVAGTGEWLRFRARCELSALPAVVPTAEKRRGMSVVDAAHVMSTAEKMPEKWSFAAAL
jgi:hypothetical protein